MSITKHTEEKAKGSLPGEPLPGEPPVKEQKNAPQPGPPVAVRGASETEGDLIIIRGQGPLLYEGVYGEGPIIETLTKEEDQQRKAEAKKAEETAKADAEKAKAEEHKAEKAKAEEKNKK